MNIEKIALEVANELGWSLESSEKFIACCLSKLAEQDVEPVAYTCSHAFYRLKPCSSINGQPFIPLYTEAQLLAAQQRTAEACAKVCNSRAAQQASETREDEADKCADSIRNGDWREYL